MDAARKLLAETMQAEGITAYALSKRSGVSQQALSSFFTRRSGMSLPTLEKLFNELGYQLRLAIEPAPD